MSLEQKVRAECEAFVGSCRSLLLGGDVFIAPESDDRRAADRKLGYIHPCSAYPLSDLELETPGEA